MWVWVCVYVCVCVCFYVCVCVGGFVCVCNNISTCVWCAVSSLLFLSTIWCISWNCGCVCACVSVSVSISMCVCVYLCVFVARCPPRCHVLRLPFSFFLLKVMKPRWTRGRKTKHITSRWTCCYRHTQIHIGVMCFVFLSLSSSWST